jgi:ABC-2 type transport system ATP-binding protein
MPAPYAAIRVRDLEKTFRLPRNRSHTLKERALHPFRRGEYDEQHVLRGVSFDIAEGEFFGIVGRNGSGKSTLLKCLAEIYRADRGTMAIAGRLAPFIELGVGFNPDLTARENVLINAVMMGLTPAEARARFDDIIAFAELEAFVDQKLKNYSSGMQVRLAFAVMVQSRADVLLIDEVLAVGDAAFQQKCADTFYRMREEGTTIVLVTHAMGLVERFCHRAMLLHDGLVEAIGEPREVARRYLELNFQLPREERELLGLGKRGARVVDVWVEGPDGLRTHGIQHGEEFTIQVVVEALEPMDSPAVGLWLENEERVRLFTASSDGVDGLGRLATGERSQLTVRALNTLRSGHYYAGVSVGQPSTGEQLDAIDRATDIVVYGGDHLGGLVQMEHRVEVSKALEEAAR